MEYIAAALEARGHNVTLVDLRYSRSVEYYLRKCRPELVGVASMHTLETEDTIELINRIVRFSPEVFCLVVGHAAARFPSPFFQRVVPELVDSLASGMSQTEVGGLLLRNDDGLFRLASSSNRPVSLDEVPLPTRHHVDP